MTVLEAIIANVQIAADDNLVKKCLSDVQDADPAAVSDPYTKELITVVDMASIEVLQALLSTPDVTEGGYSVRYNRQAMQTRLSYLQNKAGVPVSGATVKNVTYLW